MACAQPCCKIFRVIISVNFRTLRSTTCRYDRFPISQFSNSSQITKTAFLASERLTMCWNAYAKRRAARVIYRWASEQLAYAKRRRSFAQNAELYAWYIDDRRNSLHMQTSRMLCTFKRIANRTTAIFVFRTSRTVRSAQTGCILYKCQCATQKKNVSKQRNTSFSGNSVSNVGTTKINITHTAKDVLNTM